MTIRRTRLLTFGLLWLGWSGLTGCSGSGVPSSPTGSPPNAITAGVTAPIDGTYASYGQIENRLAVVVWSDIEAIRCGSGSSPDTADFQAYHRGADGRELRWQGVVDKHRSGTVTINGNVYELAEGRLLLATIQSGRLVVEQLDYGVEQFEEQDLPESLRAWLQSEPEVKRFFEQPALEETTRAYDQAASAEANA